MFLIPFILLLSPQIPGGGTTITVKLISLDVVVTDPQGHPILGLDKADFTVLDKGKPVQLQSVEFYSSFHPIRPNPKIHQEKLPGRRLVFLIQRTLNLKDLSTVQELKRDLLTFFDHLPKGDRVALFTFRSRLQCLQDFTQDKGALKKAIEKRLLKNLPGTLPTWIPKKKQDAQLFMDAVETLAQGLGHFEGRKELILFSYGFGRLDYQSVSLPIGEPNPSHQFDRLVQTLQQNTISLHGVDLHRAQTHTLEPMLSELANKTGGQAYFTFTSFLAPLKDLNQRLGGYYLLTFPIDPSKEPPGFHPLKVTVPLEGVRVWHRKGYWLGNKKASSPVSKKDHKSKGGKR